MTAGAAAIGASMVNTTWPTTVAYVLFLTAALSSIVNFGMLYFDAAPELVAGAVVLPLAVLVAYTTNSLLVSIGNSSGGAEAADCHLAALLLLVASLLHGGRSGSGADDSHYALSGLGAIPDHRSAHHVGVCLLPGPRRSCKTARGGSGGSGLAADSRCDQAKTAGPGFTP